ncbi:hypothetical protein ACFXPY_10065 [Streptomyces sp. NPDC059153]|uniref:hypothetical protein n=1 Tax=Streptomyces sp. NPDC059153 TaxID=3346743 RepID=UPI003674AC25
MAFSNENTAPYHLHSILTCVRESGKGRYDEGWVKALEAEWDSVEFTKRHAEVVNLLLLTIQQLQALPERSRDRFMRYVPAWWSAIIQPKVNWADNGRPAVNVVGQDILDHLESAAEIIAGSLVGSDAVPRSGDLNEISQQCQDWIAFLQEIEASEIDGSLKDQLIAQLEHVVWLIEHVDLFGGARVAGEASRVIGSLAQVGATMSNAQPETAGRWKRGWLGLIAVCLAFNAGVPVLQESIGVGGDLVKEIASVVQDVQGE